ncbi:hypothetical protein GUITHDRAFT_101744 [Guillardia theta CCMP2712]|uniref:Uncharacterized protein n=1 Tax=Guillardia theta (strain CCMP2712) TaxID=905079 RepID=L1JW12_GUITC|nr:hypothetical protein GUITHDRAFT_101744 [Guillardia theta CCMP2712]EKX52577.1 hypothetical protein GUITHDRAFT_101744 [Guillardia theta CCMP2712]|eukprot:XP_005839557.1 hypothetical protein GUITHDRAFT_101744 [Guillardia theta CCMP2712]
MARGMSEEEEDATLARCRANRSKRSREKESRGTGGIEIDIVVSNIFDALAMSRAVGRGREKAIILRGGMHRLHKTLELGPQDSLTTFLSFPGETATIRTQSVKGYTLLFPGGIRVGSLFPDYRYHGEVASIAISLVGSSMGYGGPADVFSPPRSYWATKKPAGGGGATFARVSGIRFNTSTFPSCSWEESFDPQRDPPILHAFHAEHWGNWQFRLNQSSRPEHGELTWHEGGFQEARGSAGNGASEWYVENVWELTDSPLEWYWDKSGRTLFFVQNGTSEPPSEGIVAAGLAQVISVVGAPGRPVKSVRFQGIRFAHTCSTFLQPYEAPNGGDWSLHPRGMLTISHAERVEVLDCHFLRAGGNGLVLRNLTRNVRITGNHFSWTGDSAIVLAGFVEDCEDREETVPLDTLISHNFAHELGIWGKQTGFVYQALAARTKITHNVAFNGPRAGICFTDGYGGGHEVRRNVLFNFVRETSDHGLFNSWDRQPYITRIRDGRTWSPIPKTSTISKNLFLNGYRSVWPIDHDDGSGFYHDHRNVLVYGGFKSFLGSNKTVENNLYLFPDAFARQFGSIFCASVWQPDLGPEVWRRNTCVKLSNESALGGWCGDAGAILSYGNRYFMPHAVWRADCGSSTKSMEELQARGLERGSSVLNFSSADFAFKLAEIILR